MEPRLRGWCLCPRCGRMGEAMNLLADLYSTIDSKKRQLKGLLSDPVETIRQGLLNFRDDQSKLLNDFGVGYQTPGYKSVLATPEQVRAAQQSVADWGAKHGISHGQRAQVDRTRKGACRRHAF